MQLQRLIRYFEAARTCNPFARHAGIEIETLFVDRTKQQPITRNVSQSMFLHLAKKGGWHVAENGVRGSTLTHLKKAGDTGVFELVYELGWNNIELITPPWQLGPKFDEGLEEACALLQELRRAGETFNAEPLQKPYDDFKDVDTLVIPDPRDEVWLNLDGAALRALGHIASVHFSVDLQSIEEGMYWIAEINALRKRAAWPDPEVAGIWDTYLHQSLAGYEMDRYGDTPASNFIEYCTMLSRRKVVMNRKDGVLVRMDPALPFYKTQEVDIDLFLRSVWWGARLRVRNGNLVLEIRDIPRYADRDIGTAFNTLRRDVGF